MLLSFFQVISETEYQKWSAEWAAAENDYTNADELKYKLMEEIEVNLELLGKIFSLSF